MRLTDTHQVQAKFEQCTYNCMTEYEKKLPQLQQDIEKQLRQSAK